MLFASGLVALVVLLGALWGVWAYQQWTGRRERRATQVVAAVMAATTLRRSLPESLRNYLKTHETV